MVKKHLDKPGTWVGFLERFVSWGIVVMLTLVPLLYSNGRIASAVTSKQFFIIGCIDLLVIGWVWLMAQDLRYRISIKNAALIIPGFLFLVSMAISTYVGADRYMSLFSTIERGGGLVFMVHMLLLSMMVVSLVRVQQLPFVKSLVQAVVVSATGVAIMTFFTQEAINIGVEWLNKSVGGAMLGNSTIAGAYFIFALFGVGFLWLSETKPWKKILYGIGSIIILFSPILFNIKGFFVDGTAWSQVMHNPLVIIGQARAAALSLGIGVIIAGLAYLGMTHSKKPVRVIAWVLILISILGMGSVGYEVLQDGSRAQQAFMDNVGQNRITFWHEAFSGIAERPWFGWGPENFKLVHQKYFDPVLSGFARDAEIWVDKPHNALIETVVTQGYVGLIAYIIFIGSLIAGVIRLVYLQIIKPKYATVVIGLLVAYILQNQLAFDSIISYVCLWVLVGVVSGYTDQSTGDYHKKEMSNLWKGIVALTTVICLAAWLLTAYFPSRKMITAQQVFNGPINVRSEQYADLFTGPGSLQLNTDLGMMLYTLAESYLSQRMQIMQNPQYVEAVSHEVDKLLDVMDKVGEYAKDDYRFAVAGAIFQETQVGITQKLDVQRIERMNRYSRQAIAISPTNPYAYMIYSKILLYTQNISEARSVIDKAIMLNPTIKEAYIQKVNFEKVYGTHTQQQAALAAMKQYFPEMVDSSHN